MNMVIWWVWATAVLLASVAGTTHSREIWIGTSPFCQGDPRDCPVFDMNYVRSHSSGDGAKCWTGEKVLCRSKTLSSDLQETDAKTLTLISYNIFERPFFITHDGQRERTCRIPRALLSRTPDVDVIVFQEAFLGGCWHDTSYLNMREILLHYGFKYTTGTVGSFFIINGGVFIASKWPIERENKIVYKNSYIGSADILSKKGAIYAKINKLGSNYHIFGTHMQAQPGKKNDEYRVLQAGEMRDFINAQNIDSPEAVIIAGDFNADRINNVKNSNDVLQQMQANQPKIIGELTETYDPQINDVVEDRDALKEWLDYTVYNTKHKIPEHSSMEAIRLIADEEITYCNSAIMQPYYVLPWAKTCSKVKKTINLSDHYPVIGKFKFN